MSRREDLRPWARRVPGFVLRLLLVVALPIFIVVGAWEDGIKESLEAWLSEWRELGELPPVAPRGTQNKST